MLFQSLYLALLRSKGGGKMECATGCGRTRVVGAEATWAIRGKVCGRAASWGTGGYGKR